MAEVSSEWREPPTPALRKVKAAVEQELMVRLGAEETTVEIHPLIKLQRHSIPKSFAALNYKRIKPPQPEKVPPPQHPWSCDNKALRQMSDVARHGPRSVFFQSYLRPFHKRRLSVAKEDEAFHLYRQEHEFNLTRILSEWAELQEMAFPDLDLEDDDLNDLQLVQSAPASARTPSRAATSATSRPDTSRTVSETGEDSDVTKFQKLWRDLKAEVELNIRATRLELPEKLPRMEVLIYLCSTPDMTEEREFLADVAFPELKRFCERYGVTCHVIDLRHGGSFLKNDFETLAIFEHEIDKCRENSIGPVFVALLGEELDDPEGVPLCLYQPEYDVIRREALAAELDDVTLMEKHYKLDRNLRPPSYVLQGLELTGGEDEESEEKDAHTRDCLRRLHLTLLAAVNRLHDNDKLGPEAKDLLQWSVIYKELERGLLSSTCPAEEVCCFMLEDTRGKRPEGLRQLCHTVQRFMERRSCEKRMTLFSRGKRTLSYLRNLCNVFLKQVVRQLKRNLIINKTRMPGFSKETREVMQHVLLCRKLAEDHVGQSEKLEAAIEFLNNPDHHHPLVVSGPEGSGKTCFLAKLATQHLEQHEDCRLVVRFLGRSFRTATLSQTLVSVCNQIALLYGLDWAPSIPDTPSGLLEEFSALLHDVSPVAMETAPLLVVLDGLDRLHGLEPHAAAILAQELPPGISMVLSAPLRHPCVNAMKTMPEVHAINLPSIPRQDQEVLVERYLTTCHRKLPKEQKQLLEKALAPEENPLVVLLAADVARSWSSMSDPKKVRVQEDLDEGWVELLERVEAEVGVAFTKYSLAFLAAARLGLTEGEWLHLLVACPALLDAIHAEVEGYSVLEGLSYQLLLSRLSWRMAGFLSKQYVEGEPLLQLSHPSLSLAVHHRYLQGEFGASVHAQLATYFRFIRSGLLLASRDIAEEEQQESDAPTWRLLVAVPFHLMRCHTQPTQAMTQLKEAVFFDFSWLVNALHGGFAQDLLHDLHECTAVLGQDHDVAVLRMLLLRLRPYVETHPVSLSAILSGLDSPSPSAALESLLSQARAWLAQLHVPLLVPVCSGDLYRNILSCDLELGAVKRLALTPEGRYLVSATADHLTVTDLTTRAALVSWPLTHPVHHIEAVGEDHVVYISGDVICTFDVRSLTVKSICISSAPVTWFQVCEPDVVFFSQENRIKRFSVSMVTVTDFLKAPSVISTAGMAFRKPPRAVTLHVFPELEMHLWQSADTSRSTPLTLVERDSSSLCRPLHVTLDARFVVHVCSKTAYVLDAEKAVVLHHLQTSDQIVHVTLARSQDHVMLASADGSVQGFSLSRGKKNVDVKIPPVQSEKGEQADHVTEMTFSEDDHFLLAGCQSGALHVFHVPTSTHVLHARWHKAPLQQLRFLSGPLHFQHVVSVDSDGRCRLWNFQIPLLRARKLAMELITDADLEREEQGKLEPMEHRRLFELKGRNKMFQNGPDIVSFFGQAAPDHFSRSLTDLDPFVFAEPASGESALLKNVVGVQHVATGHTLGEVLAMATLLKEVQWWSMVNGRLLAAASLQECLSVDSLVPVWYDQAVLMTGLDANHNRALWVEYNPAKKKRAVRREGALLHALSKDRAWLLAAWLVRAGVKIALISLTSGREVSAVTVDRGDLPRQGSKKSQAGTIWTASPSLATVALVTRDDKGQTTVTTILLVPEKSNLPCSAHAASEETNGEVAGQEPSPAVAATEEDIFPFESFAVKTVNVGVSVTQAAFLGDSALLLGTDKGEIIQLEPKELAVEKVFALDTVVACLGANIEDPDFANFFEQRPHEGAITTLRVSHDRSRIMTSDEQGVSVWSVKRMARIFSSDNNTDHRLTAVTMSLDNLFVAIGYEDGVITLWSMRDMEMLCSFRAPGEVVSLDMAADNERLVAIVTQAEQRHLLVLELRNTEDYALLRAATAVSDRILGPEARVPSQLEVDEEEEGGTETEKQADQTEVNSS